MNITRAEHNPDDVANLDLNLWVEEHWEIQDYSFIRGFLKLS